MSRSDLPPTGSTTTATPLAPPPLPVPPAPPLEEPSEARPAPPSYTIQSQYGTTAAGADIWQASHGTEAEDRRPLLLRQAQLINHRTPEQTDRIRKSAIQLSKLQHPNIPPFLRADWQGDRILTVQVTPAGQPLHRLTGEPSLSFLHNFIHSTLDILIYLQSCNPLVSHRELCPQNLWTTSSGQASLLNFRINGEKRPDEQFSSVTAFVAPEILAASQPHPSTDLYSFGLTLIALIGQLQPDQVQQLRSTEGRIAFQRFIPVTYSLEFIRWIETLVQAHLRDRFPNAAAAFNAFEDLSLARRPGLTLKPTHLVLVAQQLNESLTHSLIIRNRIPDTNLEGQWQVLASDLPSDFPDFPSDLPQNPSQNLTQHPSQDPSQNPVSSANPDPSRASPTKHPLPLRSLPAWLHIEPRSFKGNDITSRLTISTRTLRSNQTFRLTLVLTSNAEGPPILLPLEVRTAQFQWQPLPWKSLGLVAMAAFFGGTIAAHTIGEFGLLGWGSLATSLVLGSMLGGALRASNVEAIIRYSGLLALIGMAYGTIMTGANHAGEVGLVGYIVGAVLGIALGFLVNLCQRQHRNLGASAPLAWGMAGLVAIVAALWGIQWIQPLPKRFDLGELSMLGLNLTKLSPPGLPQVLLQGSSWLLGGLILYSVGRELLRWSRHRRSEAGRLCASQMRAKPAQRGPKSRNFARGLADRR